jgi:hypothetical protein
MTHTLHRIETDAIPERDFAILCMASQKFNDQGAAEKLKKIFNLLHDLNPDNIADDNLGGIYTGETAGTILNHMNDKAYIGVAFAEEEKLREALRRLKEADLGMSVVVSGNFEIVFKMMKEVGLKPHTVNMSLGTFGKTEILPKKEVLEITCMCGHGMVSREHVETAMAAVKSKKLTSSQSGRELAHSCTCGIFNPKRAEKLIEKHCNHTVSSEGTFKP